MEQWLAKSTSVQAKKDVTMSKGKGRGVAKEPQQKRLRAERDAETSAGVTEAIPAIGELSLETARNSRMHSGGLFRTLLLPVVQGLELPVRITAEATGTDPGLEHCKVWAALILSLVNLSVPAELQSAQLVLKTLASAEQEWQNKVHFCRVCKTYDQKKLKVQFSVDSQLDPAAAAVARILVAQGGELMFGPPPRSARERKVAGIMANLARR
ncbi:unnamed protein product [Polarella glacialis]|uniref:Uncharacterized protein n=1 Tax=Polarella glacialis TaxID=89957 RepID=A0A813E6I1_POLGL|nr:unnamed protein product [Polarella glacialis]